MKERVKKPQNTSVKGEYILIHKFEQDLSNVMGLIEVKLILAFSPPI
jgi:hypothetical protein